MLKFGGVLVDNGESWWRKYVCECCAWEEGRFNSPIHTLPTLHQILNSYTFSDFFHILAKGHCKRVVDVVYEEIRYHFIHQPFYTYLPIFN